MTTAFVSIKANALICSYAEGMHNKQSGKRLLEKC